MCVPCNVNTDSNPGSWGKKVGGSDECPWSGCKKKFGRRSKTHRCKCGKSGSEPCPKCWHAFGCPHNGGWRCVVKHKLLDVQKNLL